MQCHTQLVRYHAPAQGIYGDCLRTCIGCLLNLAPADVPHFLHDNSDDWLQRLNAWLAPRGLTYLVFCADNDGSWQQMLPVDGRDMFHLITIRTAAGHCHQMVGRNGAPVWCPVQGDVTGREFNVVDIGFLVITSCYT
jgi:hypothetical protein